MPTNCFSPKQLVGNRHLIRHTLLVPCWPWELPWSFCGTDSTWVLEEFLRDLGPYRHDSITQLLQIYQLHIYDVNLLFQPIPEVLYWIEIWWLWSALEYNELIAHAQETSLRISETFASKTKQQEPCFLTLCVGLHTAPAQTHTGWQQTRWRWLSMEE